MPGDYSRFNDITGKRRAALRMQQGRVQLDSDFNELVDILTTRDRLQALDTFGRAAVPRETSPDAFKLTVAGSDLLIGAGRMYVDGLLVESFGDAATGNPDSYLNQPFYPEPYPFTAIDGSAQVFLDVWQREVTAIEDLSLLDPALGDVDTATRLQTVWQVRFRPSFDPDNPLTCASSPGSSSAGRLTVTPAPSTPEPDLCLPPDTPGFYDIENRHYRVQIHDTPSSGMTARYKWSREGASVVSRITNFETINVNQKDVTRLTVDRIGRDAVLRLVPLDWVEVMDDIASLTTMSGTMAQVIDVDEASQTVTLDREITSPPQPENHPRLILWNQRDGVDGDGLLSVKVGQTVPLERGLAITFTLDPPTEVFHRGDYWLFPARMADPMAMPVDRAKPLPEHHFAPLGMIERDPFGYLQVTQDCRVLWPDCDCGCGACVTPESHFSRRLTIQMAIDKVTREGGGTVCLNPGVYFITERIVISGAEAITILGLGRAVLLPILITPIPMIDIRYSSNVTIENVMLSAGFFFGQSGTSQAMVTITDCRGPVTLLRNQITSDPSQGLIGVTLRGELFEVYLLRNVIQAAIGVDCFDLGTVDARFRDNVVRCGNTGIRLYGEQLAADISNNTILDTAESAIWVSGSVRRAAAISICGNSIDCNGDGIVASADDVHIENNSISSQFATAFANAAAAAPSPPQPLPELRSAIWIMNEFTRWAVRCHILENRIVDFRGNGVRLTGVASAMIKQNYIHAAYRGIVMDPNPDLSHAPERMSITNNQIVGVSDSMPGVTVYAIQTENVPDLTITDNQISGTRAVEGKVKTILCRGFQTALISGNSIDGSAAKSRDTADIFLTGRHARVMSNSIRRQGGTTGSNVDSCLLFADEIDTLIAGSNDFMTTGGLASPIVFIWHSAHCTFADNVCTSNGSTSVTTIMQIHAARSLIVTSNRTIGGKGIALDLAPDEPTVRWTVLGNITDGDIHINKHSLPDPWIKLNREVQNTATPDPNEGPFPDPNPNF